MTFPLKMLFIVVTVAATLLGIFFALPFEVSFVVCLGISVVAPAGFVSWIVYGRGYGRAFAIGCTTASAVILFSMGLGIYLSQTIVGMAEMVRPVYELDEASEDRSVFAVFATPFPIGFGLVIISGFVSILIRWLTRRDKCLLG